MALAPLDPFKNFNCFDHHCKGEVFTDNDYIENFISNSVWFDLYGCLNGPNWFI